MEEIYIGSRLSQLSPGRKGLGYTRVNLLDDDGKLLETAGDDTGDTLNATTPDATQAMAAHILASVRGYAYHPYEGLEAMIDPAAELGDGVTLSGLYSVLAGMDVDFDAAYLADIKAPMGDEIDDEYPYLSPQERALILEKQMIRSLISKTAEQIRLEVKAVDDRVASIDLSLDEITLVVAGLDSAMSSIEQKVDSITLNVSSAEGSTTFKLMAGEAELSTKTLNLSVDAVNVTGQLTASQINATDLKVAAANITGSLRLDQMASISFADLSDYEEINNDINDAYAMAQQASEDVTETAETVSGWRYGNTTRIDSEMIEVTTLRATELYGGEIGLLDNRERVAGGMIINGASSADYAIELYSGGALRLSGEDGAVYIEAYGIAYLTIDEGGPYDEYSVVTNRDILANGTRYLGRSGYEWAGAYFDSDPVISSDAAKKTDIQYDLSSMDSFFDDLKPATYQLVNGTSGRYHSGFVAQDVKNSLTTNSIATTNFAGYVEETDASGVTHSGLRYGEFVALLVDQVQKLKARVAVLEGKA